MVTIDYREPDTLANIPTVVSHDADDESGEVIIDDGWGLQWELHYRPSRRAGGWVYWEGRAVPRSHRDPAARMNLEPPENLIALGLAVLEAA